MAEMFGNDGIDKMHTQTASIVAELDRPMKISRFMANISTSVNHQCF